MQDYLKKHHSYDKENSQKMLLPFAFGYGKSIPKLMKRKASVSTSARKKVGSHGSTTVDLTDKEEISVYETLELGKLGLI